MRIKSKTSNKNKHETLPGCAGSSKPSQFSPGWKGGGNGLRAREGPCWASSRPCSTSRTSRETKISPGCELTWRRELGPVRGKAGGPRRRKVSTLTPPGMSESSLERKTSGQTWRNQERRVRKWWAGWRWSDWWKMASTRSSQLTLTELSIWSTQVSPCWLRSTLKCQVWNSTR